MAVSLHNKMEQWLKFFLVGDVETAKTAIDAFIKIIAFKEKLENETILSLGEKHQCKNVARLFIQQASHYGRRRN